MRTQKRNLYLYKVSFYTFKLKLKDVKVKKIDLIKNIYHVFGNRVDKRERCCKKRMNIHDYRVISVVKNII